MRPDNFDVQVVIDCLQGTCGDSIQSALDFYYPEMQEDDLTGVDHQDIDNQIFLCEQCGWWCETSEAHENTDGGGDLCDDCFGELHIDEE